MSLKDLKENKAVAMQLSSLLCCGRAVHAFLLVGSAESCRAVGKAFSKAILCPERSDDSCDSCLMCRKFDHGSCEDFLSLGCADGRQSIVVSQIEELQEALKYKAMGAARVVLIEDAHLMNAAAQNKLLKTLEEPFPGTYLILLARNRDALLPTIISRCSTYQLQEEAFPLPAEALDAAKHFFCLARHQGAFYEKKTCIKSILDAKDESRARGMEFLQALEAVLHESALACAADPAGASEELDWIAGAMSLCEESMRNLRASYNTSYVLKTLCLKI